MNYNGEVGTLKNTFLSTVDYLQNNPEDALKMLMIMLNHVNNIAKANESLILIDDYVSKATLDILRRRKDGVSITIYTTSKPRNKDRLSENEIKDFNNQYGKLEVKSDDTFHDRFLIIDNKELYSIGASLKDAGSKTFAINRMDNELILRAMLEHLS